MCALSMHLCALKVSAHMIFLDCKLGAVGGRCCYQGQVTGKYLALTTVGRGNLCWMSY